MQLVDEIKLVSFNILAPCYKRLSPTLMESDQEDMYMSRNRAIIQDLQEKDPDIICLQEIWLSNEKLVDLYEDAFGHTYFARYLQRQSSGAHNNNSLNPSSQKRKDGLAIFVKKNRFEIEDTKEILFQDGGDRVALLLRLRALAPFPLPHTYPSPSPSLDRCFVVVNTHLLFPHNEGSKMISVREVAKVCVYIFLYFLYDNK